MWKFFRKIIVMGIIVSCLFVCVNFVWYKHSEIDKLNTYVSYFAISNVKQQTDCTTLLLGDSVAGQIFNQHGKDNQYDHIFCVTTFSPVTPAGNYLLLREFHDNNPQLEEVYYIDVPSSYFYNTNFSRIYSYFVTPFYNSAFKDYLNDDTCLDLEQYFGSVFSNDEFFKWTFAKYPKLMELYLDSRSKIGEYRDAKGQATVPNLSTSYIQEMQKYCTKNGIELHLLFCPVRENYEFDPDEYLFLKEYGGEEQYQTLINSLLYIDEEAFSDGLHFTEEYISENREALKERILQNAFLDSSQ